jgi:putative transposase
VLVDTLGLLLAVVVLAADVSDRDGALVLLDAYHARYPALQHLWGDSHYGGDLGTETEAQYGIAITVVQRAAEQDGFVPLPRRWVVERSLAWLTRCRRLARDYERDPAYSEAWIHVATIHQLTKRLAPDHSLPTPYQRRKAAA